MPTPPAYLFEAWCDEHKHDLSDPATNEDALWEDFCAEKDAELRDWRTP